MGKYNVDLTPEQTATGPIKVTYTFNVDVDPRAAMVIAADFGAWLIEHFSLAELDAEKVPMLAAEFIKGWEGR